HMELEQVGGKPYLLLGQYASSSDGAEFAFSIYRPSSPNWDAWEPVTPPRLGRAFGMVALRQRPAGAQLEAEQTPAPERLGVFHERRITVFDLSGKDAVPSYEILPFSWVARTAATLKGKTYAFGVELPPPGAAQRDAMLKVAGYDGAKWEELNTAGVKVPEGRKAFSLQAVEFQDCIKVLWREAQPDQTLHRDIEGPREATDGPLTIATFDGQAFVGDPVPVTGLPRGNTCVWAGGDQLKVLVQRRAKLEDAISSNGPMEIWRVTPTASAKSLEAHCVESVKESRARDGLMSFIAADYLASAGREFIVRSNWQMFEIWRKTPDEGWVRLAVNPRGLQVYDLEALLLAGLATGLALVAFGAGLAYHRRKQALTIMRKVQASEIYASLSLRMGAYLVDLTLVLAVTFYLTRLLGWPYVSPVNMLPVDFTRVPYWPFFVIYLAYTVGTEWLLGTTAGKFVMGLCVVADTGERVSLWAALVRNLLGFYERLPQTFVFVAVPMILFGPRRQRLGDMLARTFVVQKGALVVFKAQRAEARARGLNGDAASAGPNAGILPPIDPGLWDSKAGKKKKASDASDGNDDKDKRP
ncbi:MAG: RDD family protein, partial [Planctomycetota bacterium]|nr:RDD family protein [Planctomycetota bacterium]